MTILILSPVLKYLYIINLDGDVVYDRSQNADILKEYLIGLIAYLWTMLIYFRSDVLIEAILELFDFF